MSLAVDQAINDRLSSYVLSPLGGLVALVGSKIYNIKGPNNATASDFPMVVFGREGPARIDSAITGQILLRHSGYRFTCLALTHSAARNVAEEVIAAMQGYRDSVIKASELSSDEDSYEPDAEPPLYCVDVGFTIIH